MSHQNPLQSSAKGHILGDALVGRIERRVTEPEHKAWSTRVMEWGGFCIHGGHHNAGGGILPAIAVGIVLFFVGLVMAVVESCADVLWGVRNGGRHRKRHRRRRAVIWHEE